MGNAENNRSCIDCINNSVLLNTEPCKSCSKNDGIKSNFTALTEVAPRISRNPINDNVNHPSHYTAGKYECIDIMLEIFGVEAVKTFCLLNAFKYNYRSGRKNGLEDIQKAKWYIDKYIELSE